MEDYQDQHPIPQHISSYQFRLVGDMTLKQFAQLAGGALIALLIYSSGLNAFIKWPLAIFAFVFGVALAFFPFQDRPISVWIVLFFKSIYSPTVFKWRKTDPKTLFFQPEETETIATALPQVGSLQDPNLDKKEKQILNRVAAVFKSLMPKHEKSSFEAASVQTEDSPLPSPTETVVEGATSNQVQIPQPQIVSVEAKSVPQVETAKVQTNQDAPATPIVSIYGQAGTITGQSAQFSPDAAPPIPPTRPNIIVGQAVGPKKEIVEGVILEIKDYNRRPIRALKSNQLGHFMIVTPLLDGKYELTAEKPGYEFETVSFDAKNEIIPPIVVSASHYEEPEKEEED